MTQLHYFRGPHRTNRRPTPAYLRSDLRLVIRQKVVVELRTVEHACKRLGGCGVGLGCIAVVAGHGWSPGVRFGGLFTGAVNRRLLRETLVRQEIGLDSVLPGERLDCGRATTVSRTTPRNVTLNHRAACYAFTGRKDVQSDTRQLSLTLNVFILKVSY